MQGGGTGAHPAAIVYDVDLTLDLPRAESVGTALNALAHCAEALYVKGRSAGRRRAGARGRAADRRVAAAGARPTDPIARRATGSCAAQRTPVTRSGSPASGSAHAMAQALGGRYGIPHGAMNALCLPPALEFNRQVVPDEVARFGEAIGGEPVERTRELALLGGFERLRDFGVPREDLADLAEAAALRGGNRNNPSAATPSEIEEMFVAIW